MRRELKDLREKMKTEGVDACLIPTSDYHGSEYVGEYFKCRKYISGFTGSAGTLVVTADEAGLWTDGRYFLQAERQLAGSGITLRKQNEPGVPSVEEYLEKTMTKGQTFAFDGRCLMAKTAGKLCETLQGKGVAVRDDLDLPGAIWMDRPALSCEPVWELPVKYAGKSRLEKIAEVRDFLREKGADYFLLASLTDIAWLLNIRGNDVECTPVVLSYLMFTPEHLVWYVQENCLTPELKAALLKEKIVTASYDRIYEDVKKLPGEAGIYYDSAAVNYTLLSALPEGIRKIEGMNPTARLKAIKNPVEVENERLAHIRDGVAVTKFIYWLKTHLASENITEITAAAHLEELRRAQKNYVEPSFAPIVAYREHGAVVHYSATPETDALIRPESFVLADTGGHYLEGTTDITRTIAAGSLTQEEKEMYTSVLRGHINLAAARFLHGCTGQSLDCLARTPLWEKGLDYNHGTGHGVGYLLSVHEGPNSFRYRRSADERGDCVLEEGMITSDEPGLYLAGKFGVRLENLIVCRKDVSGGYGNFLCFEPLTLVPFEREAILPECLTEKEKKWLNAYHEKVYETLSLYLTEDEGRWLREVTAAL